MHHIVIRAFILLFDKVCRRFADYKFFPIGLKQFFVVFSHSVPNSGKPVCSATCWLFGFLLDHKTLIPPLTEFWSGNILGCHMAPVFIMCNTTNFSSPDSDIVLTPHNAKAYRTGPPEGPIAFDPSYFARTADLTIFHSNLRNIPLVAVNS